MKTKYLFYVVLDLLTILHGIYCYNTTPPTKMFGFLPTALTIPYLVGAGILALFYVGVSTGIIGVKKEN